MFRHADDDGGFESMKQEEEQHMSSLPDYFSYYARESKIWTLKSIYEDVILFPRCVHERWTAEVRDTAVNLCILHIVFIFNQFSAAKRRTINFIVSVTVTEILLWRELRTFTTHITPACHTLNTLMIL